ncbi:glycosyltransferase [Mycobacterium sp. NPDC003449]
MKIAMVSGDASPLATPGRADAGGQNVHVAALSAALSRRGHRVTVYTRRDDPALPDRVRTPDGYTVAHVPAGPPERIPSNELLQYLGRFAQFLDTEWALDRPDVVHAHAWMSGVATQLAARHLNLPAIQTFHGLGVVERRYQPARETGPPERLKLEAVVARGATWTAATCTEEMFELMRLGCLRSRTSVVPCGVDLDRFTPAGRRARRNARHRLVSVGKMAPHRGFEAVIRSLPKLADTELVIVGGPATAELARHPEARRLRALAAEMGVAGRVTLCGAVTRDKMPEVLRSADVVTCTPWYETFGIVPLEAMACGVPVVATSVGGMLDTIVDQVTGRLVSPKRPDLLVDTLHGLLRDDFGRRSLGAAGRDRAGARYSWDRIAADTLQVYDRVGPRGYQRSVVSTASTG